MDLYRDVYVVSSQALAAGNLYYARENRNEVLNLPSMMHGYWLDGIGIGMSCFCCRCSVSNVIFGALPVFVSSCLQSHCCLSPASHSSTWLVLHSCCAIVFFIVLHFFSCFYYLTCFIANVSVRRPRVQ